MPAGTLVDSGTRVDLLRRRQRLHDLEELHTQLVQLGYRAMAERVWQDRSVLYLTTFEVRVPCVLCRQSYPVPVQVGDPEKTMPNAVLCATCSQRVGDRID